MARLTKEERYKKLQEEIKKKKQMMKEIEKEIQMDIGKTVMNEWEVEDELQAKEIIIQLKTQAKELLEKS